MFYFCAPLILPKARGCQSLPALVHVALVANKSLSRKSICRKNIRQLRKEAGWSEPEQGLYHQRREPPQCCGRSSEDVPAGASQARWTVLSVLLGGRLLCPCPFVSLAADLESWVGASDGASLRDVRTHGVPPAGGRGVVGSWGRGDVPASSQLRDGWAPIPAVLTPTRRQGTGCRGSLTSACLPEEEEEGS